MNNGYDCRKYNMFGNLNFHRPNNQAVREMGISLPRSALIVLDNLANQGPACPKEIADRLDIAPRTVSFALRKLRKRKLCKRIPNFHDMRKPKYLANKEKLQELEAKINEWRAQLNVQLKVL